MLEHGTVARVEVRDIWTSRWGVGVGDILEFSMVESAPRFEGQENYVVLLSGGPYRGTPLTQREHSFFHIEPDESLRCGQGTTLFAVASSGFLCSVDELVEGRPLIVSQMHSQLSRALGRAIERHPDLNAELWRVVRRLEPIAAPDLAAERRVFR